MKNLIVLLIFTPIIIFSQSFPSDAKVLQDVKKYHGKIATAEVQNDWKLERESGYNFSNMAKRVVAGTTIKENGTSKKIIGLAIYIRGGAGEAWSFSRYFVTNSEVVGAKSLTVNDLVEQTKDLARKNFEKALFSLRKDIVWIYNITFPGSTPDHTDRTGDIIYKGSIEYEYKFNNSEGITLPNYPFEAGIRRHITPIEAYVRLVDGQMKVDYVNSGYSEPLNEKMMSRKDFEALPIITENNFDQHYGPECPFIKSKESESINVKDKIHIDNSNNPDGISESKPEKTSEKKKIKFGLPKIKIKGS
jgi:hypothetical protein